MRLARSLLAVEAEGFQHRRVVHRKENRLLALRTIGMLMPVPERHDEGVAFFPMKRPAVDDRRAAAAIGMIQHRARVAVRLGALAGLQELKPAGQGRQRRPAGQRIDVLQRVAFVRMGFSAGQ